MDASGRNFIGADKAVERALYTIYYRVAIITMVVLHCGALREVRSDNG